MRWPTKGMPDDRQGVQPQMIPSVETREVPSAFPEQVDEMADEGDARRYDRRFSRIAAA